MTPAPGYLLPSGDAYTDELACALVFYPDKTEYRRALLGSIVYLSNWLAWERDVDKRGKDAARAWKNAVDATMECWNMACFEELIEDVERIRILLENKKDCCDNSVTYYPTEEPTTEIEPGVGDPPEFYGETAIADWDEWLEHVCWNAHKYVDHLKDTAEQLEEAVSLSSIFIGVIGASLALLAFSGLLLAVPYALAAAVVAGIVLLATSSTFQDTSDDFEASREDIVCAIATGASLPDAIETALGSGTDWDLFYAWIDYEAAIAIMYEGGWDDEFLPAEMRDDCDCEETDFNGFERWLPAAVVDSDETFSPPSCHEWYEEATEAFTTINSCAVSYSGKVRLKGYITIVGAMASNSNCTNQMWLEVWIRTSGHTQCEMIADQGDTVKVVNKKTESTGAKDYNIPYDFVTNQTYSNIYTFCIEMMTNIRSGLSHQIVIENHVLLIEEGF